MSFTSTCAAGFSIDPERVELRGFGRPVRLAPLLGSLLAWACSGCSQPGCGCGCAAPVPFIRTPDGLAMAQYGCLTLTPPNAAARGIVISCAPGNQMPMRMKHRLPRRLP